VQSVCLIVPCYNEAHRLDVPAFERFMRESPQVSFCFVNDASSDGTFALLVGMQRRHPGSVRLLDLPSQMGKAEAVRRGILYATAEGSPPSEFIGFWDADLATPLDEVHFLYAVARNTPDCAMVLGSRIRRLGSTIHRKAARHYLGRVFATFASLTLRLPVYDTQCGAKLVRTTLVHPLFDEPFVSRWIFDVELLARLRNLVGAEVLLASTVEAPLNTWRDVGGSKLTLRHMLRTPLDLWRIARRYNQASRVG
jgi:glycosyltransferase involved in cell wall biosynthesis